jgi:hypothetical protein
MALGEFSVLEQGFQPRAQLLVGLVPVVARRAVLLEDGFTFDPGPDADCFASVLGEFDDS